jgi:hypothetical protein
VHDLKGKELRKDTGDAGINEHVTNFIQAVRGDAKLNSPIAEGAKSTLLCHLGNIAYRTGQMIKCDASNGKILNDPAAMKMWSREYQPGWEPTVS